MKSAFVQTSNVKRYLQALSALEDRGAAEACFIVVDGEPGLGKTTTLRTWVAQTGSIYLRAKKEWDPGWFMDELLEAMGAAPPAGCWFPRGTEPVFPPRGEPPLSMVF